MRSFKLLLTIIWVLLFATIGLSSAGEKGGKELYKQHCRICHEKGSPNGELSPVSLIQDQWKSFYKERLNTTHKDLIMPAEGKKLLEILTPEQIKLIEKFCIEHAADSEQPQTCS